MTDVSLQSVLHLNQEITALSAAGLPLDIGIDGSPKAIADKLDRINAALSNRIGRGQTIQQAIAEEAELPARYRATAWTWLHADDPTVALDGIVAPAEARTSFGRNVSQSMAYPLIVLSLTLAAFAYLCNMILPKIEAIYAQLWQTPSPSVSFLGRCRDAMPVWGIVIPLLVILAVIVWRSRSARMSWSWMPGSGPYFRAVRSATIARQLATLLESGCSLDQSLALLGLSTAGDAATAGAAGGDSTASGGAGDHRVPSNFPPLLQWALSGDLGGERPADVLRFVADTYRQTAQRQAKIWRYVAPSICGVVLGGCVVLGYGLSLFLPLVQLLKDVALPGGS